MPAKRQIMTETNIDEKTYCRLYCEIIGTMKRTGDQEILRISQSKAGSLTLLLKTELSLIFFRWNFEEVIFQSSTNI
jgi:hypothetical protein